MAVSIAVVNAAMADTPAMTDKPTKAPNWTGFLKKCSD
jgi:hypothetical protein